MANPKIKVGAFIAAALIIVLGATWYFASPVWTLHQMKAAADSNDPDGLSSYIDYPALRANLKSDISGQLKAEEGKAGSGLRGLGLAIGTVMIDPLIDNLVTPAGVRAALTARRTETESENGGPNPLSALHLPDKPLIVHRGFSEFLVATKRQPTSGLVFKRHGLSWKLSGVDLPPN